MKKADMSHVEEKLREVRDDPPLLSVIVSVCAEGKSLSRCIESIQEQSYAALEIILVPEGAEVKEELIREYAQEDSRIKILPKEKNKGLFKARLAGAGAAAGRYIAFVDGDDWLSVDYFRRLMENALISEADIILSDLAIEKKDGQVCYYNLDNFRLLDLNLEGEQVLESFMNQRGFFWGWYAVCGRIYKKALWDRCRSEWRTLETIKLNYGEDIAFSGVLWRKAQRVTSAHHIYYFFGRREQRIQQDKECLEIAQNLADVFAFFRQGLKSDGLAGRFEEQFQNFRKLYLKRFFQYYNLTEGKKWKKSLKRILGVEKIEAPEEKEIFLEKFQTNLFPHFTYFEDIKQAILSGKYRHIGFDVFDTLIVRPFFFPSDLFCLLNQPFNDLMKTEGCIDFALMRRTAEQDCRVFYAGRRKNFEDVTLDEIYEYIHLEYCIPREIAEQMKAQEIELELRFCSARKTGMELFKLAQYCGREIILISDMYLPTDVINAVLHKNGYEGYTLFLSNEAGCTKQTGTLYHHVLETLDIEKFCFIGDNYFSDVTQAEKYGIKAFHIPKTIDILKNDNSYFYSGNYFSKMFMPNGSMVDGEGAFWLYPGLRCMLAVAANILYDFPFVSYDRETDFNCDPRIIGAFPLGMFFWAIALWLAEETAQKQIPQIHFVARDGFYIRQAFDLLARYIPGAPKSNYLYASRKALTPLFIREPANLFEVFHESQIKHQSPRKIVKGLEAVISEESRDRAEEICRRAKIPYSKPFGTAGCFYEFVPLFEKYFYDAEKVKNYRREMREYFSGIIQKGDVLFDIGYSARTEFVLSSLLGWPINSYYLHAHEEIFFERQKKGNFHIHTFLNYKPVSAFIVREHLFLPPQPSCVGYDLPAGEPVFDEWKADYPADFIDGVIHDSAMKFVSEYASTFGAVLSRLPMRHMDASLPMEYFLHFVNPNDKKIFACFHLEDDFGMGENFNIESYWHEEASHYRLVHDPAPESFHRPVHDSIPGSSRNLPYSGSIYRDGVLVAAFNKINRWFPYGTRRREWIKKAARILFV